MVEKAVLPLDSARLKVGTVIDVDAARDVNLDLDYNIADERLNAVVRQMGLARLRKVQAVAIQRGLFFRKSLLVISPSGSGKTLVGELAAANCVLEGLGKAAYLVPLKALATEKYKHFQRHYARLGIKIEISIGDYDLPPEDLADADIVVMTYEKLDSMLRSARGGLAGAFGCLVIDEIHVMGEAERGPRLESLLIRATRALGDVQLIALSATVANPGRLNEWLSRLGHDTLLLVSRERPVPLEHEIVLARDNVAAIAEILDKVAAGGGQCLVFTRSRRRAELLARQLASTCEAAAPPETYQARVELAFRAKRGSRYSDLPPLLVKGIAYHHAGLDARERDLVEHAFLGRHLVAICCTTTLSAGINMPARAVVLEDYKQFTVHERDVADKGRFLRHGNSPAMFKPIPRNAFHQIVGRAGRAGFDDKGSAYILVHSRDEARWVEEYYFTRAAGGALDPAYDPLQSALSSRDVVLEQLLVFANEAQALEYDDIKAFFAASFYSHLLGASGQGPPLDAALKIRHATARDLVAGTRLPPGQSISIVEAGKVRVAGAIVDTLTGKRAECQLTSAGGYACTCGAKPGGGFRAACEHLRLLVAAILEQHPALEPAIDGMLAAALREE
ncbi:MAG: DEAD/DEAH box helicase, partial [Candidatus Sigynarchaeota archaeon]